LRYIYNLLIYLLLPLTLIRLTWRSRNNPAYKQRWNERFARFDMPKKYQHGIWFHAVSVGEVIASAPLIKALIQKYPEYPMVVTTMTPTGSERVKANLPASVFHVYAPYDFPDVVNRFYNKVKPKCLILMETELWPNILFQAQKRGIPSMLANARLSARSAKGYNRFQPISGDMVRTLSVIAAQAKHDKQHFIDVGADPKKIQRVGNMKFDLKVPASIKESAETLRQQLGADRPIWIAASTHEGEEEEVLKAFKIIRKRIPNALLILVPRHRERFDKVAHLCEKKGFKLARRSKQQIANNSTDIFLGDTMGELQLFYSVADAAFIGGSFSTTGGHNMLEAAVFSLPVLTGPNVHNFLEISQLLEDAHALIMVKNAEDLADEMIEIFTNSDLKQSLGLNAKSVIEANGGSLQKHLDIIETLLA
jgi:3-deoxy-D-manno-octulosonic-acid transferase